MLMALHPGPVSPRTPHFTWMQQKLTNRLGNNTWNEHKFFTFHQKKKNTNFPQIKGCKIFLYLLVYYHKVLQSGVLRCDGIFPVWHIHAIQKCRVGDRENQTHKPVQSKEKNTRWPNAKVVTTSSSRLTDTLLFELSVKVVACLQLMPISSYQLRATGSNVITCTTS